MIADALVFLRDHLDAYLRTASGVPLGESQAEAKRARFIATTKTDSIVFGGDDGPDQDAMYLLLVNVEEDKTLRSADPRARRLPDGSTQRVQPDVRLNLYVLFVARFKDYERALNNLSFTIQYFQTYPVFNRQNAPALNERIEQLVVELTTLTFSEQSEILSGLRLPYHPSVLYKVKMIVFRDEDALPLPPINQIQIAVST